MWCISHQQCPICGILDLILSVENAILAITKRKVVKMTTLTQKHIHTPHMESISTVNETEFTFCEECEDNIFRFWLEFDGDRLDMWSEWKGGK